MELKYLSIEEAARKAGEEEFFQNVKAAVIPRLIEKGLLRGKKEEKGELVADDDALARVMRLGVESFVYNRQAYSFMVVRAPIQQVAQKLKSRPGVAKYEESVTPAKMEKGVEAQPDEKIRDAFLVQTRDTPEWSVLIQTVHWFQACDSVMGTALACALSKEFQTLAAAAWDDDFSGSSLIVCENGNQKEGISGEDEEGGWEGFYEFFYEHGISLPESFIGAGPGNATLYVSDPAKVQRADHVVLKVPRPIESKGPHVFEKLGMMAEAVAGEIEDEEEFMEHMRGGVWREAQAILASGEF
jgi:hypothetical protein